MPKNLGLYNNDLSIPRKEDVDVVKTELEQLTSDVDAHIGNMNNPHEVNKEQVGLGNVENVLQYSATNPPPYPVTSVNGLGGAVNLTAASVGALPTQTGVAGQFLGFTAENVVGAVDVPEGGGAEVKEFYVDHTLFSNGRQNIQDSFFETKGYVYVLTVNATAITQLKDYVDAGIYAYRVTLNGTMPLYCRGEVSEDFAITVCKIACEEGAGRVFTASIFWADIDGLKKELTPDTKTLVSSSTTIPAGRMAGDVNGDGKITNEDYVMISEIATEVITPTEIEKECADIDGSGSVNSSDTLIEQQIIAGQVKLGQYSRDVLGNWSVNPNYATEEAQFYIDLPAAGLTTSSDIALAVQGDGADQIVRVEAMSGAFRVYAKLLPINPLPYVLLEKSDSSGPKSFSVTLSASDWVINDVAEQKKVDFSWPDMTGKSVIASPAPDSLSAAAAAGVYCSYAGDQTLTFACSTPPTEDIVYNILVLGG